MKEITITVNGSPARGKEGDTVLQICQASGIDIPTLCHLEGLSDIGACRMCVVEIEGERRLVPSCTYPARDGLVVQTHTEQIEKYRRQILELIFTERNHFCMYCEQSGDCELQKLAYRYQMDSVRYPYMFPPLPVDSLGDYLVIDHNRCVLCGRCIRMCSELVANYALDFGGRGWKGRVVADLDEPLSESSCTSCGACLQACPTGAIFSKVGIYRGTAAECEKYTTVCPLCGVGCELSVLVKDNNILRLEAPHPTDLKGSLCKAGRFDLLRETRQRLATPLVRPKRGRPKEVTWEEAAGTIAERVKEMNGDFGGIVSARLPNETLSLFREFMRKAAGSDLTDTLDGDTFRVISEGISLFQSNGKGLDIECPIGEILDADCILAVGADADVTHPIVANLVRRAVRQNGAKLIVAHPARSVFPLWTDLWLKPISGTEGVLLNGLAKNLLERGLIVLDKAGTELVNSVSNCDLGEVSRATGVEEGRLALAAELYGQAERSVIIYGQELTRKNDPILVASLFKLAALTGNTIGDRLRVISLKPCANSCGAWQLGLAARSIRHNGVKGAYLFLGDDEADGSLLDWIGELDFVVVQASHESAATELADVVLPSFNWAEREGTYVSMDGTSHRSRRVVEPCDGLLGDREVLTMLSKKLGHKLTKG